MTTMTTNYIESTIRHVAAGRPKRSPEEVDRIVATFCDVCEFINDGRCSKCGCPVRKKSVRVLDFCPVGKW